MNYNLTKLNDITSQHDIARTERSIKTLLADGTPNWLKRPEEYKHFAHEEYQAQREISDTLSAQYKLDDQELFADRKARMVNIMHGREFLRKLRENGVRCFTMYAGLPSTVGLWAVLPSYSGADPRYICYMQIPYMCEWSVVKTDAHGIAIGEDYRGWRTVLWRLIQEGALTEEQAHAIFGEPHGRAAKKYRHSLWLLRNGYFKKGA